MATQTLQQESSAPWISSKTRCKHFSWQELCPHQALRFIQPGNTCFPFFFFLNCCNNPGSISYVWLGVLKGTAVSQSPAWLPKGLADGTASITSPLPQLSSAQPQEGQVWFLLLWGLRRPQFHCCSQQGSSTTLEVQSSSGALILDQGLFQLSSSEGSALPRRCLSPISSWKAMDQAWHHLNANCHLHYPLLLIMSFSHSSIHNGITKLRPPCREGNSRATGIVLEHLTCGCASSACWCFLNGNCSVKDATWKKSCCRQSCLESTARELKPFVNNSLCYLLSKHPSSIAL